MDTTLRPTPLTRPARRPLGLRALRSRLRQHPALWWSVALAATTISAWVVGGAAGQLWGAGTPGDGTQAALVATRDVPAGEVLGHDDVELRHLPPALVPPGAAGGGAVGSPVRQRILRGEVVHAARLAPPASSPVAALLPPGARGVAVPLGAATPPLEVGDLVDVLATIEALPQEGRAEEAPTVLVAAQALVVDVGEGAVTVAVPACRAPQVAYAVSAGIVTLALSAG